MAPYILIFALSSTVYLLYFVWLQGHVHYHYYSKQHRGYKLGNILVAQSWLIVTRLIQQTPVSHKLSTLSWWCWLLLDMHTFTCCQLSKACICLTPGHYSTVAYTVLIQGFCNQGVVGSSTMKVNLPIMHGEHA